MRFPNITRRNRNRILVGLAAVAAAAGLALAVTPSGAYFSDTATASARAASGNADVTISDATHAATCVLDFGTVNPGHEGSATCKVTNSGTVPLNISLSSVGTPNVSASQGPIDPNKYSVSIDSFLGWTPVPSFATPVALGQLGVGQDYTYTVRFAVDSSVGNEGEDALFTVNFGITGTQY